MKTMDLQFVKDSLAELGLSLEGKQPDDAYRTALVVVSALACGPDTQCLARFTQLPVEFVQAIRRRMIAAELWTEVEVNCDHWFAGTNQVSTGAFCADLLVAEGAVVRAWDETVGDYRYYLAEYAPDRRASPAAN
jgi:hypothetical protein